jgi:hypothetical protein
MQSVLNQSYSLDILPDTDPTGTTSFGLNAGMAGTSLAEGDHQFFVRTFYAENVDNSTAGTAPGDVLDSFLYGAFPAFANKAAGGTVVQKDWRGETFDIDKIHFTTVFDHFIEKPSKGMIRKTTHLQDELRRVHLRRRDVQHPPPRPRLRPTFEIVG